MNAAVAQLSVVQVGFFCSFAGQLRDAGHRFAVALALLNLLQHHFCRIEILMQVVVNLFFDEVADKLIYAYAAQRERMAVFILGRRHHQRAEFDLRLTFKHRLNDAHGDGGNESVSNVLHVEVLAKMLLNRPRNVLLKGALMRAA